MTATKEISVDYLREKFRYDPATGELFHRPSGRHVGAPSKGYLKLNLLGTTRTAHRVAWALYYGEWPRLQVDHLDRDRSNNRIENLRLASPSQNNMNMGVKGAVKAKGVSLDAKRRKFKAEIKLNGVTRFLGYFESVDEAAHAYNKAAIQYFGDFACLNPIGEDK
ncbi:HNH endonuclease [Massilia agilis]|uniref:HNH endonuclease n=1 Tax=Massilia agilis TaxID=1811226 RepID=A0ABT2DBK1_9BURK|nr:HNH endonuclease [Massilia agilis]MCS0808646.1 HNH endonuclease [Massilia agilis]